MTDLDKIKQQIAEEFPGWSDSAVAELAEIHLEINQPKEST